MGRCIGHDHGTAATYGVVMAPSPPVLHPPVAGPKPRVSSPFAARRNIPGASRKPHSGMDLAIPQGTPLLAAGDGVVAFTLLNNPVCGYGVGVDIDHSQYGVDYCHMSKIVVTKGQRVKAGQLVGYSGGAKGTEGAGLSTGPHVHMALVRRPRYTGTGKSQRFDPDPHIRWRGSTHPAVRRVLPPAAQLPPGAEVSVLTLGALFVGGAALGGLLIRARRAR